MKKGMMAAGVILALGLGVTGAILSLRHESNELLYDGVYIDLIDEAEYAEWLAAEEKSPEQFIMKVSTDTGYMICRSINDYIYPQFVYDGKPLELRFENDVLTGYRLTYRGELQQLSGDLDWDTLSEEERAGMEKAAFAALWSDDTWVTEPECLEAVLSDYAKQVSDFLVETPPHSSQAGL